MVKEHVTSLQAEHEIVPAPQVSRTMTSPAVIWEVTIALIAALLLFDYFFHVRAAHILTISEAARWSAAYVTIALLFGAAVFAFGGAELGTEYFAGYITEKRCRSTTCSSSW